MSMYYVMYEPPLCDSASYLGLPAATVVSIPHSLMPRTILKSPRSPHSADHEFTTSQYFVPAPAETPFVTILSHACRSLS